MTNELTTSNFDGNYITYYDDEPFIQLFDYVLGTSAGYLNNCKRSSVQYSDNEILVEVEVPRFKKNEINLLLKDEFLIVKGVRKTVDNEQNTFTEKIRVGNDINSDTVSACLADGVLYVTLSKTEQSKGKQILITE